MKIKKKSNKLPGLRSRVHASGIKYYYYEPPNNSMRTEIALGNDFKTALMKRAKVVLDFDQITPANSTDLRFILLLYQNVAIPMKAPEKQSDNLSDIGKITKFSTANKIHFSPDFRDYYEAEYILWRGINAQIRTRREWSLIAAIFKWFSSIKNEFLEI